METEFPRAAQIVIERQIAGVQTDGQRRRTRSGQQVYAGDVVKVGVRQTDMLDLPAALFSRFQPLCV